MESVKPIQILTPVNHKHELGVENLKEILEQREIKDRFIVAFSIGGAFRKGISFLLNFFLKYLYAQVSRVFNSDSLPEPKSVLMVRLIHDNLNENFVCLIKSFFSIGNGRDK